MQRIAMTIVELLQKPKANILPLPTQKINY